MNQNYLKSIEGNFNFESLICNLFYTDIDPSEQSNQIDQSLNTIHAFDIAFNAKRNLADTLIFQHLQEDLLEKSNPVLFHERLHYWQIIFCPLLQLQFVLFLDKLRLEVARMNGIPLYICGQTFGNNLIDSDFLDECLESTEAHFKQVEIKPNMIKLMNLISTTPLTAMPYLEIPLAHGKFLPGYGALLEFGSEHKKVVFPFNGRYLIESAAYISQLLYEEKPLPIVDNLDNLDDQVYLGAWEFWRRLHGNRYTSEKDLALGFLAVVDLAVTSDVIEAEPSDIDYSSEQFSIPYRFGKLVYRIQGISPFSLGNEEPAVAINRFQKDICEWCGWPSFDYSIMKMASFLTKILIGSSLRHFQNDETTLEYCITLFKKSDAEWAKNLNELKPYWNLFQQISTKAPSIGQMVLGNMLNACIYRIENPGEFSLPHIYYKNLSLHFPLPIVLLNGKYFLDKFVDGYLSINLPYPCNAAQTTHDIIALTTIKPIKNKSKQCGFIEECLDCWYIKAGFGCPKKSLSRIQSKIRKDSGMDDWCHWTLRNVLLRTAPEKIQRKWRKIVSET